VLGAALFLYQLHYDKPLPVSNRWLVVAAALVLGGAAFGTAPVTESRETRGVQRRVAIVAGVLAALVVVGGVAVAEPDATPQAARVDSVRVVTFNVHDAVTRSGRLDPETISRTVERLRPDVLVIEEAGRGWPLSSTVDLGEWLKRRLGLSYRWAPAADGQMGNLLFSRVPIRDARVVQLPQGSGTMKRSAVIARVGPVDGRDLTVAGVHFQNGSSAAAKGTRIPESDVLLRALGHAPRTVIVGDFNMDPGERDLRHLLDAGYSTSQASTKCAVPTSNDNCVDWILVSRDLIQGPPQVTRVPSFDHNAVAATVRPA
jgi:endonuclease/exonuclease/phosphatase family metal-dependent hydrolase